MFARIHDSQYLLYGVCVSMCSSDMASALRSRGTFGGGGTAPASVPPNPPAVVDTTASPLATCCTLSVAGTASASRLFVAFVPSADTTVDEADEDDDEELEDDDAPGSDAQTYLTRAARAANPDAAGALVRIIEHTLPTASP